VPGSEHVGHDTHGLDADRVGVDLGLGEGGFVVLEPKQEGVLEGEAFDCCAYWRPEEKDPTVAGISTAVQFKGGLSIIGPRLLRLTMWVSETHA